VQRSVQFPALPTVDEAGLPGYESASINGMLAVAGTPATLLARINGEVVKVLNRADIKERFLTLGVEVVAGSPDEFAAFIRSEADKWGRVIKNAKIPVD